MNYLIIEDEVPAQRLIKELLRELRPQWETAACLDSVESSVNWLNNHPHPEVIFMDIRLSDGLCFDILEQVEASISEVLPGAAVFTHMEPLDDPASWNDLTFDRSNRSPPI